MTRILDELEIPWRRDDNKNGKVDVSSASSSLSSSSYAPWLLLPMQSKVDLQSSDLGDLLERALNRAREHIVVVDSAANASHVNSGNGSVVFLGMDSPALPLEDILIGLGLQVPADGVETDVILVSPMTNCSSTEALICPADDGGYGMLSVPASADASQTFQGIQWSHALTAVSQIKALTDQVGRVSSVRMGTLMYDIDEPEDVTKLCLRLKEDKSVQNATTAYQLPMVLDRPSGSRCSTPMDLKKEPNAHPTCFFTREALLTAGLL